MKINSISIANYRSITTVKELPLSDYSVILGKNNEGKTNILSAIKLAIVSLKIKAAMLDDTILRKTAFFQNGEEKKIIYINTKEIILCLLRLGKKIIQQFWCWIFC